MKTDLTEIMFIIMLCMIVAQCSMQKSLNTLAWCHTQNMNYEL